LVLAFFSAGECRTLGDLLGRRLVLYVVVGFGWHRYGRLVYDIRTLIIARFFQGFCCSHSTRGMAIQRILSQEINKDALWDLWQYLRDWFGCWPCLGSAITA